MPDGSRRHGAWVGAYFFFEIFSSGKNAERAGYGTGIWTWHWHLAMRYPLSELSWGCGAGSCQSNHTWECAEGGSKFSSPVRMMITSSDKGVWESIADDGFHHHFVVGWMYTLPIYIESVVELICWDDNFPQPCVGRPHYLHLVLPRYLP